MIRSFLVFQAQVHQGRGRAPLTGHFAVSLQPAEKLALYRFRRFYFDGVEKCSPIDE